MGTPGILSRPRRERIPPVELGGGNGAPLDVGGTLVLPLEWRRIFRGTCMPPLETRTDSPVETPELPQIHVSTGEESSGSGTDSTQGLRPRHRRERNPQTPSSNSHGDWPFLRPRERVPEVPIVCREHLPQLEKIQEVFPPGAMRPISAEATRG